VGHGPPVPETEVERSETDSLEVRLTWESSLLATRFLGRRGSVVIGDHVDSIARIPSEALGCDSFEIATATEDGYLVHVPAGAEARVRSGATSRVIEGPTSLVTLRGDQVKMTLGNFGLELVHGAAGKQVPAASLGQRIERSAFLQVAGAALMHAAFFGVFAYYTPALAAEESSSGRDEQIVLMRQYLESSAVREPDRADEKQMDQGESGGGGPSGGARAIGEEGKMGKENAPAANLRWGKEGTADRRDASLDRTHALQEATTFGMISMLTGDPKAPIADWGRIDARGADPLSAQGNMWGSDIGDAPGFGGLGMTGTGIGGGGPGEGIGINMDFTGIGHGPGLPGGGDGIGGKPGCPTCARPGHDPRGPQMRMARDIQVNGHIPPEVIQRVVRNNFGRFRSCYMNGLRDNPRLEGRVVTRFSVDRQGLVSSAQDGGSSLPNPGVVSCVVKAFYGLTFPEHEGGLVTVVYPLAMQPE
jgi:hypothetical protein